MSTDRFTVGELVLRGMTTLRNRRQQPAKPLTYVFDGLFSCGEQPDKDGVGSFRHYIPSKEIASRQKQEGTYEIAALIAPYRANRNCASDEFAEKEFDIIGEIETMQPLIDLRDDDPPSDDGNNHVAYDDTMRVSVAGTVDACDKSISTFYLTGSQYICGQHEDFAVCARTDKNTKWKHPSSILPRPNAVITCEGFLDRFETCTLKNRPNPITRVVVAVQRISFLQAPREESPSTALSPGQKTIRDKIKRRKQKQIKLENLHSPSTADNSPEMSLPSSSQNVLGKHLHDAFDSDDDEKIA